MSEELRKIGKKMFKIIYNIAIAGIGIGAAGAVVLMAFYDL